MKARHPRTTKPKHRKEPTAARRHASSAVNLQKQLDHRTRELREAREQQAATAEILRIISDSPTDVQPVFDTIVRNFVSLCGSTFGVIYTFDGELVHFAGACGFSPEQLNGLRVKYPVRVDDRSVLSARAIRAKAPVHIQDALSDPDYDREHAARIASRRMLAVPMLREGVPLGAIVANWAEAGATPKQNQDYVEQHPIAVGRGSVVGRTALDGRLVHIPDVLADPEYTHLENQKIAGYRATLGAPLLREGNVVGVIFVGRAVPQPFSAKQI